MIKLNNITKAETVDFLIQKIPTVEGQISTFSRESILELEEFTASLGIRKTRQYLCELQHRHSVECAKGYLLHHPLLDLLKGMPLAISIMASQCVTHSLQEIYSKKLELNNAFLTEEKIKDNSLLLSMEFLIKILEKEEPLALDVFFLIGLMPAGFSLEDLEDIFKKDLTQKLEKLESCSLID